MSSSVTAPLDNSGGATFFAAPEPIPADPQGITSGQAWPRATNCAFGTLVGLTKDQTGRIFWTGKEASFSERKLYVEDAGGMYEVALAHTFLPLSLLAPTELISTDSANPTQAESGKVYGMIPNGYIAFPDDLPADSIIRLKVARPWEESTKPEITITKMAGQDMGTTKYDYLFNIKLRKVSDVFGYVVEL